MRYAILIYSNPKPWGHPTSDYTAGYQALPQETRNELGRRWDAILADAEERGEIVTAFPLGDPADALVFRAGEDALTAPEPVRGPYAQGEMQLAGCFLIEVADEARARAIAESFAVPGEEIELRAVFGEH